MSKVQILMSTYNGEKYVEEQVESILNQTYKNLELIIRDDGSKDNTKTILKRYSDDARVKVIYGENIGSNRSFFELLRISDSDYVAFSDQDDYWLPNKIERAIETMQQEKALLYCGNKVLVDKNLNIIKTETNALKPSFENAVIESICTGCTSVLSRELVNRIKSHIPNNAIVHDWWVYLVATYYGKVYFDNKAYIYYRQHESNQIGAQGNFIDKFCAKAEYLKKSKGKLEKQLKEFRSNYREDKQKNEIIDALIESKTSLKIRLKLFFGSHIKRQSRLDGIVVRFLILFGGLL